MTTKNETSKNISMPHRTKPMLGDAFIRSILNLKNKQYEF